MTFTQCFHTLSGNKCLLISSARKNRNGAHLSCVDFVRALMIHFFSVSPTWALCICHIKREGAQSSARKRPQLGSYFQTTYACTACYSCIPCGESPGRIMFLSWLNASTWWYVEKQSPAYIGKQLLLSTR